MEEIKTILEQLCFNTGYDGPSHDEVKNAAKEVYRLMLASEMETLTDIYSITNCPQAIDYCEKRIAEINSEIEKIK
jgi:hypothetical protein